MENKSTYQKLMELPEEERNEKIKQVIDALLSTIEDWDSIETKQFIIASRRSVFNKYGNDMMNYLDEKLLEKGFWNKATDKPQRC